MSRSALTGVAQGSPQFKTKLQLTGSLTFLSIREGDLQYVDAKDSIRGGFALIKRATKIQYIFILGDESLKPET